MKKERIVQKLVYLSLGSNLGNREAHLRLAIIQLASVGEVVRESSLYETEPVERTAQPWFLNCAVEMKTEKMPRQLLAAILKIEEMMGRRRTQDKGPRMIDIDILLFGTSIVDMKGLSIPHPAMQQRRFVLQPMAELAPDLRHPVSKRTIRELLDALPPGQTVKKLTAAKGR
jgi:2-amino-4-hydroxy-6-hydroxymethyldihydropteridine diphosphokinase